MSLPLYSMEKELAAHIPQQGRFSSQRDESKQGGIIDNLSYARASFLLRKLLSATQPGRSGERKVSYEY